MMHHDANEGEHVPSYENDRKTLRRRISAMVEEAGSAGAFARKAGINPGSLDYLLNHDGESSQLRRKYKIFKGKKRERIIIDVSKNPDMKEKFNYLCLYCGMTGLELLEDLIENNFYDAEEAIEWVKSRELKKE